MSIPTPQTLRRQNRRIDRRTGKVEAILNHMRTKGCALHFGGGNDWFLSDGTRVSATVATALTLHPKIVDVGDALPISGARAQTFRLVE
jgi:hypothetical protein